MHNGSRSELDMTTDCGNLAHSPLMRLISDECRPYIDASPRKAPSYTLPIPHPHRSNQRSYIAADPVTAA